MPIRQRMVLSALSLLLAMHSASHGGVVVTGQSGLGVGYSGTAWAGTISNNDLVNAGQPSLSSVTTSPTQGSFPAGGLNDGNTVDLGVPGGNTFFEGAYHFNQPGSTATATFQLNLASSPAGYDITSIQSFMGWDTVSQAQANQTYTVAVKLVGSSVFNDIATVSYTPFPDVNGSKYESRVVVSENTTGILASGVESIRFTFLHPLLSVSNGSGIIEGTLIRELDVFGTPTGSSGTPAAVTVQGPRTREIVQRGVNNTASISIQGAFTGSPDSIEARMVVMPGTGNTGIGTAWTTVATSPVAGAYSGTLSGVTAGGWYQLEVRPVTGGEPGNTVTVPRVGIGDIYITCGQSNAANDGSPPAVVLDDRVSAWNHFTGAWTKAADPMPGASSGGGSVWTRLGDLLAARDNVPIAFACLAQGATTVSQWTPASNQYYPRVRAAVRNFPVNGFRAVLWHQGESDSVAGTSAALYQVRISAIIQQSRADAGWTVPWYLAEASFHPSSSLTQEEPVVAGQRRVIHGDPLVFPGPVTDDFHLEGKLSDTVHFNSAGFADHANQWAGVLGGNPSLALKNGAFENNSALADGSSAVVSTSSWSSPSVIGWRALDATGEAVSAGAFGCLNPADSMYPGTSDGGPGGGVINGMSGRHIAFLAGSSAGDGFLQTRRAMLEPGRTYELTASLGVRGNGGTFGGARLEILADGSVIGSREVNLTDLDALNGGNAAGKFTDVSVKASTGPSVVSGRPISVRITKPAGASSYLDFDNVRLVSTATPFTAWRIGHWGDAASSASEWNADPDGDSQPNGIEYLLGSDPRVPDPAFQITRAAHDGKDWRRFEVALDPAMEPSQLVLEYSWDLVTWNAAETLPDGTVVSERSDELWWIEVSTTDHPHTFFRIHGGTAPD